MSNGVHSNFVKRSLEKYPFLASDITAGFIVFLLALPLSIGIAMASGFPPLSGLLTVMIGGVVVGLFSGAPGSIKGPAAGMIVIMLGAVEELGAGAAPGMGVRYALSAVVVVGLLQILMGKFKLAEIGKAFPESTVKGMLSAIGVIIIAKQFHLMMGHAAVAKSPLALIAEFPAALAQCNPQVAFVGVSSLVLMIAWPLVAKKLQVRALEKIPVPLVVITVAVIAASMFGFSANHQYTWFGQTFEVGPKFLVNVPNTISSAIITPDFSKFSTGVWWKWMFMIAAVGSLESVLSVKATDAIDPLKRRSDCSQDLLAVGIGNTLCGLLGGLPMITEIVRSSANLNANAKSKWSNIFHGFFMVVFVVAFPWMINMIPLAALSGLLVFTGFRLASPRLWGQVLHAGKEQFLVFVTTLIVTLATDLLIGIGTGLICELLVNVLASGSILHAFKARMKVEVNANDSIGSGAIASTTADGTAVVKLMSPLTFTNLIPTIETIKKVHANNIVIDFSRSSFIDHTSMSALAELRELQSEKSFIYAGFDDLVPISAHPHSARLKRQSAMARVILKPRAAHSKASRIAHVSSLNANIDAQGPEIEQMEV